MKVLLDTNVLIEFFRAPEKRETFESRAGRPLVFLSSIVVLELFAGCRTSRQTKALESFLKPFEKAGRILIPDYESFRKTGKVLAALGRDNVEASRRRIMVNDVLIAVTAVRSGAVLVSANAHDFRLIEQYLGLRWILPDSHFNHA